MPASVPIPRRILATETQTSDNAVKIVELPKTGALHSLIVRAACTNGSTHGQGVSIFDVVDNIEVLLNGSQVVFSLLPEEIEKRYEWRFGRALNVTQNEAAAGVQRGTFPILFGRDLYDPQMWLPLSRNHDYQLRLTFSPTISATAGFATGTTSFEVVGLLSHQAPSSYLGTLVTRMRDNFTSAASGDTVIELPTNFPYRDVMIYAYEAAIAGATNITNLQLEVNDGEYDLINHPWNTAHDFVAEWFRPEILHRGDMFRANDDTLDTRMGRLQGLFISPERGATVASDLTHSYTIDALAGDRATLDAALENHTAASEEVTAFTTDDIIRWLGVGVGVGNSVLVPFDYDSDPASWFQGGQIDRLRCILTNGNAGADVRVSTQTLENLRAA